jgi:hypothetical protein
MGMRTAIKAAALGISKGNIQPASLKKINKFRETFTKK